MLELFLFQSIVFFFPSQFSYHFWPKSAFVYGIRVDYLSPAIFFTDLLIGAFIILSIFKHSNIWLRFIKKNKFKILLFFALSAINIFWSINIFNTSWHWLRIYEFVLFALAIRLNKKITKDHLITPLILALGYTTILALWQFASGSTANSVFYYLGERSFNLNTPGIAKQFFFGQQFLRPYATFPHPNSLSASAGLILLFFLHNKKIKIKKLIYIFTVPLLLLTSSLNVYLALFFAYLLKRFKYLVYLVSTLSFLMLFWALNYQVTNSFRESYWERIFLLKHSLPLLQQHFLTGLGLGNYIYTLSGRAMTGSGRLLLQPAHNIYVLMLTELGMPFSALLIITVAAFYKKLISQNRGEVMVVSFILLTGLFDHYWLTLYQNQLLLTLFVVFLVKEIKI